MPEKDLSVQCPRCGGSGICIDCQGQGKIECPACSGQGFELSSKKIKLTCKSCQGTGFISCPAECPSCQGTGVISESMQKEQRSKYATPAAPQVQQSSIISKTMAALCIIIYIAAPTDFHALLPQPIPYIIQNFLVNTPYSLENMQLWRFLTPAFIHGGMLHLACNMYFLLSFGPVVESALGAKKYLAVYLLSAIAGNTLSWLFNPVAGIGASSALFGIGASYCALAYKFGYFPRRSANNVAYSLGFVLLIGIVLGGAIGIRLDNWAHLGGGIAGYLITCSFKKVSR